MAIVREIPERLCVRCRKKARVRVFDKYGAPVGYYCRMHGELTAAEITIDEGQEERRVK